jgi:hypothetical protein
VGVVGMPSPTSSSFLVPGHYADIIRPGERGVFPILKSRYEGPKRFPKSRLRRMARAHPHGGVAPRVRALTRLLMLEGRNIEVLEALPVVLKTFQGASDTKAPVELTRVESGRVSRVLLAPGAIVGFEQL